MTPEELRARIPALTDVTYLNTGASGPSPRHVVEAAQSFIEYHEYEAPGGEGMYTAAFDAYDDARTRIADFVGANERDVALTQSTGDGINRVACALEWEPGDVVVRTDLEHPAGILPFQRLEQRRGVEVRVVGSDRGRLDLAAYRDAVVDAKLVCFSSISWNYGTRLPVAELVEIAHDAGALVLVDAVQSTGQTAVSIDEWGADFVAAAGHKWMLGLWGAGFLYVRDELAELLEPRTIGYRSIVSSTDERYELKPGARRFEVGTTNPAPYVALETAIESIDEIGLGTIERRIERLTDRLKAGIPSERLLSPTEYESGLVTVEVDEPEATVERLAAAGIVVRSLPNPDAIRASLHAFNNDDDVDELLGVLESSW